MAFRGSNPACVAPLGCAGGRGRPHDARRRTCPACSSRRGSCAGARCARCRAGVSSPGVDRRADRYPGWGCACSPLFRGPTGVWLIRAPRRIVQLSQAVAPSNLRSASQEESRREDRAPSPSISITPWSPSTVSHPRGVALRLPCLFLARCVPEDQFAPATRRDTLSDCPWFDVWLRIAPRAGSRKRTRQRRIVFWRTLPGGADTGTEIYVSTLLALRSCLIYRGQYGSQVY